MQEQIIQALREATRGSRRIRITFKQGLVDEVNYLLWLARMEQISLPFDDECALLAVSLSRRWDNDRDRTTVITLTGKFTDCLFVGKMSQALESVEVVK